MSEQNVQPVPQSQGTVQPSLPAPQQPGFLETNPEDFTFGLDPDSGMMMLIPKSAQTQQQSDVSQEDVRFQQAVEETSTQKIVEPNPLEDKVNKLEGLMSQMAQFLQGIVQGRGLSNLNPQQEQEEEIDLSDGIDGKTLVNLINSAVEKALSSKLGPIQEQNNIQQIRNEYNDAAFKYGQEFIALTPAMVELKKSDPSLSWEVIFKAMQLARNIPNGKSTNLDSTIQTDNGSVKGKPQSVQTLVQKAQAMKTETGGQPRAMLDESVKITTVDAAFNKAMQQLGLG